MTISDALVSIDQVFTKMEYLLVQYLKYDPQNDIKDYACQMFLIHSFAKYKYFKIIKLFIDVYLIPFLENKNVSSGHLMFINNFDLMFSMVDTMFMRNIATKSNKPFQNAIYSNVKGNILNITIPYVCKQPITESVYYFAGLLLIIPKDVVQKYLHEPLLNMKVSERSKRLSIAHIIGSCIVTRMMGKNNLTSIPQFFQLCDFVLLETYKFLTSPSVLWTSKYSKYYFEIFNAVIVLVKYGYILLLIFGFICNITAILFSVSTLKLSNFNVYLLALACVDTCALIGNLLPISAKFWAHNFSKKCCYAGSNSRVSVHCAEPSHFADIYEISNSSCKLTNYLVAFSRAASAWLMVSTALVRLLAVSLPLQWRNTTMQFNIKVIGVTLFLVAIFTSPPLLTRQLTVYQFENYQIRYCHRQDLGFFSYEMETYFAALIFPVLPMCLLMVFSAVTIYIMWRATAAQSLRKRQSDQLRKTKLSTLENKATIMLLLISGSFLVLSSPYFVNTLIQLHSNYDFYVARAAMSRGTGPLLNLEQHFLNYLLSISNAINLFFYLLSSNSWRQKFYEDFKNLFKCGKTKRNTTAQQTLQRSN